MLLSEGRDAGPCKPSVNPAGEMEVIPEVSTVTYGTYVSKPCVVYGTSLEFMMLAMSPSHAPDAAYLAVAPMSLSAVCLQSALTGFPKTDWAPDRAGDQGMCWKIRGLRLIAVW